MSFFFSLSLCNNWCTNYYDDIKYDLSVYQLTHINRYALYTYLYSCSCCYLSQLDGVYKNIIGIKLEFVILYAYIYVCIRRDKKAIALIHNNCGYQHTWLLKMILLDTTMHFIVTFILLYSLISVHNIFIYANFNILIMSFYILHWFYV